MSEIRHPGAPETNAGTNEPERHRNEPPPPAQPAYEPPPGVQRAQAPPPPPQQAPRSPFASQYGRDPRYKLPTLAAILSLIPGLGQVYLGQYVRGFTNAIIVAGIITYIANSNNSSLMPLAPLFMVFFWLYNVIDAFRQATLYNRALEGGTLDEPDLAASAFRGSVAGGAVLIVVGTVLLVHTVFGLTLDWIENWWPLAPIALGVFLVARAVQDRASSESRKT